MDAPLSVTAVCGAQKNEMGMSNLIQLSTQVPGLTLGTGAQAANIYIRGVGSGANRGLRCRIDRMTAFRLLGKT